MTEKSKAFRATFVDVVKAQRILLEWIEQLIQKSKPLPPEHRMGFLELLAKALLGQEQRVQASPKNLGHMRKYDFEVDGEGSSVAISNAGDLIRFAIYVEKDSVEGRPISSLWKKVRAMILKIMPFSLDVALRSSVERVPYEKLEGVPFGPSG